MIIHVLPKNNIPLTPEEHSAELTVETILDPPLVEDENVNDSSPIIPHFMLESQKKNMPAHYTTEHQGIGNTQSMMISITPIPEPVTPPATKRSFLSCLCSCLQVN